MFSTTEIDPQILQAYLETEYRVLGEPGFILRVGEVCPELFNEHKRRRVTSSSFITACNPYSHPFDAAENAKRQENLADTLASRSLSFLPGIGQHPSNEWPGEESFLVFGLSLESSKQLAKGLEQNAFVWSGEAAIPQLILLR